MKEEADSEQLADFEHHDIRLHDAPCRSSGPASQSFAQGKGKKSPKKRPKESISTSSMAPVTVVPALIPSHHPSTAVISIGCVVLLFFLVSTVLLLRSTPPRTTAFAMLVGADMSLFLVFLLIFLGCIPPPRAAHVAMSDSANQNPERRHSFSREVHHARVQRRRRLVAVPQAENGAVDEVTTTLALDLTGVVIVGTALLRVARAVAFSVTSVLLLGVSVTVLLVALSLVTRALTTLAVITDTVLVPSALRAGGTTSLSRLGVRGGGGTSLGCWSGGRRASENGRRSGVENCLNCLSHGHECDGNRRNGASSGGSGIGSVHAGDEADGTEASVVTQAEGGDGRLNVAENGAAGDLLLLVERASKTKLVTADLVVPLERTCRLCIAWPDATSSGATAVLVADLVGGQSLGADDVEDCRAIMPVRGWVVRSEDVHAVAHLVGPSGHHLDGFCDCYNHLSVDVRRL
jgi:hypothetical protein